MYTVDRQTREGIIGNGDDFDDTVGDVEQEEARRQVVKRGEAGAAATSSDGGGSDTSRSHHEEGSTTKEDSGPTSSNVFDLGAEKEEGEGVEIDQETHPRSHFLGRGQNDDSRSSSRSGNSGDGGKGSGGGGGDGDTTAAPFFVTHGDGVRESTTASAAANGVRGVERVDRVGDGHVFGGGSGLYDVDGSDCSSYGSTLILGRPEPASVHWKYSRRLLQT